MFGIFNKKTKPDFREIRELLFGDVPLAEWRSRDQGGDSLEPWSGFVAVRLALEKGDPTSAIDILQEQLSRPNLESRQHLQIWHFLRQLGVQPKDVEANRVHGVVLEVHLPGGLDTLAAYADRSARYINHGGRLIVWETRDEAIDRVIDKVIQVGQLVAEAIGPWEEARPPAPAKGDARLSMLTPSGLHFGEGPFDALSQDPMGGPMIAAGAELMQALIARADGTA
jgi:hypothetical protein